jgi:hypothetical protein
MDSTEKKNLSSSGGQGFEPVSRHHYFHYNHNQTQQNFCRVDVLMHPCAIKWDSLLRLQKRRITEFTCPRNTAALFPSIFSFFAFLPATLERLSNLSQRLVYLMFLLFLLSCLLPRSTLEFPAKF